MKENADGGQKKRRGMAALPDLWQQDKDQNIRGHCAGEISIVLPEVQEGEPDRCSPNEDGVEQRARRIDAEPAPGLLGGRLFFIKILPFYVLSTIYLHLLPVMRLKLLLQLE